jgi:glycosyltransferase involved in cell wall biosynthesis
LIGKFLRLALTKPLLTLKLMRPQRIKNAFVFLASDNGNLRQIFRRYQEIYSVVDEGVHDDLLDKAKGAPAKTDVFVFPIIDWDFRHQRPQHIAANLGKQGYRVFYFSTTPLLSGGREPYQIVQQPLENVFVCRLRASVASLDNLHLDKMSLAVRDGYLGALQAFMADMGVLESISILSHSYWLPLAKMIPATKLLYDCMDHHGAFYDETFTGFSEGEEECINEADFVVTSSLYLHDKIARVRDNTIVRNGAEYGFFSNVIQRREPGPPIAGYVGAIAQWFDIELLVETAKRLPDWRFVLVGSTVGCDISVAKRQSNIQFVGEVDYKDVPRFLNQFDICIIPFKLNELTKATNPVKVYEYLSAGKSVVSTPLPEVLLLGDMVFVASCSIDFAAKLKLAFSIKDEAKLIEKRKEWAAQQDWSIRAQQLIEVFQNNMKPSRAQLLPEIPK